MFPFFFLPAPVEGSGIFIPHAPKSPLNPEPNEPPKKHIEENKLHLRPASLYYKKRTFIST